MPEQKVSTNFSKGLNLSISHMISLEELQQADNFMFSNGAFVREGTVINASLPYPVVALKKHYKRNGTAYIAAFAGGGAYLSYTSGVFVSVSCEATSGEISVTAYDDYLYFANLSNVVKTFDGSSIDNTGLSGPTFIKYLGDFENNSSWVKSNATLTKDSAYLHVDRGANAIKLQTDAIGLAIATNQSNVLDLTNFGPGVPSDTNDYIQVFTVPTQKANISSFLIAFVNAASYGDGSPKAYKDLAQLESWTFCSNDSWSMTHTIPKSSFVVTSGFVWGSCMVQLYLWTAISSNASVTVDNVRMVKTPALLTTKSVSGDGTYYQYNAARVDRFANPPDLVGGLVEGTSWASLSSSAKGGIAPDGTMYYKVTFVKRGPGGIEIESNPSAQAGVSLSGSGSGFHYIASLYGMPLAPSSLGVAGRKVYRRSQYESVMRHVATIADNDTTVMDDVTPNAVLGAVLDEERFPPPQARFIYGASTQQTYYLNIIEDGVIYGSRVRYSQQYAPHYVPLNNVFDISPNDGSEIMGVFEFVNILHFLKGSSTWMLDNGNLTRTHDTYGCIAPKSLAVGPTEVFWLADEGIIKYSLRFQNISLENSRIDPLLKSINRVYLQNAAGVYYRGLYLLAMSDGTSATNNMVLCYDNSNDVWSVFPNVQINCWDVWSGAKDGYRLFYGNNSGLICEFLVGNTDFGAAIPWAIRTKEFGMPTPTATMREVYLYSRSLDNSSQTLSVTPYYDFVSASGNTMLVTSGYQLNKADIPPDNDAGYISVGFSGAGRIQLLHMDAYDDTKGLR